MVDVDTGQLLGVALGGGIAAGASWLTMRSGAKAARELALDERRAARSDAVDRYLAETLQELQVAVLQLMRALGGYHTLRLRWEEWNDADSTAEWSELRAQGRVLIDAMSVVEILCSRLGDHPAADPATNLRTCGTNMLMTIEGVDEVDRIEHVLDEGLAMGQRALELVGNALTTLPPPTSYRPLAPWTVRQPG